MILTPTEKFKYEWLRLRPWRRHSLVLLTAGLMYIGIGAAFAFAPAPPSRAQSLKVPLALFPMWVWALFFAGAGVMAILSSRWPPASDTWGYTALSTISALWAAFYVSGLVIGTPASGINGAILWSLVSFLWWAITGLHNREDIAAPVDVYGLTVDE